MKSSKVDRAKLLAGARAVIRSGSVFDLTPESLAFATGIEAQAIETVYPGATWQIVFDLAEEILDSLMAEIAGLAPDEDWAENLANTTVVLLTSDPAVNQQVLLVAASQGRGAVRKRPPEAIRQVGELIEKQTDAGKVDGTDQEAELRLILTLFRGVLVSWASDRFGHEELHSRMLEVASVVETVGRRSS